jgi:hypothetical protein
MTYSMCPSCGHNRPVTLDGGFVPHTRDHDGTSGPPCPPFPLIIHATPLPPEPPSDTTWAARDDIGQLPPPRWVRWLTRGST